MCHDSLKYNTAREMIVAMAMIWYNKNWYNRQYGWNYWKIVFGIIIPLQYNFFAISISK